MASTVACRPCVTYDWRGEDMRLFVAHLKSGGCPKGSKEVSKKGIKRCKLRGSRMGHGMYGSKKR